MPTSKSQDGARNLPTSYRAFSKAVDSGVPVSQFGFHGGRPKVFRFANRYSVAHAFRSVDLKGYSPPTAKAYGALFRHLVTCSAAEQYSKILGRKGNLAFLDDLVSLETRSACIGAFVSADPGRLFFRAVCDRITDQSLASSVDAALDGESRQLSPLVRAVRHAFAHGDLAPGANGAKPGVAQKFAATICPVILQALDADFTRRVSRL